MRFRRKLSDDSTDVSKACACFVDYMSEFADKATGCGECKNAITGRRWAEGGREG
jgi:hypothetical protein